MARIIRNCTSPARRIAGFSLIEVMVAVVILATGLLALAALQGALARNSADAKARGAVMAALTSRMSQIRQTPPAAGTTWTMSTGWVSAAAAQAGTSDLQVEETIAAWRWDGTKYVGAPVTNPSSTFARATLVATWSAPDAPCPNRTAATCKRLTLSSDLSSNIYGVGTGYNMQEEQSSAAKYPIVRQDNPSAIPGVIPIASGDQATAASNPQPILEGRTSNQVVGTRFDVLTYIPEGSTARIQKRFETQVVKCRCQFESGQLTAEDRGVAGKAQWPTIWNGETYVVANVEGTAPGVSAKAIEDPAYSGGSRGSSTRAQSAQCTECCRDRHDTTAGIKYDPEATVYTKYDKGASGLIPSNETPNRTYVESCRIVRTGGLWRTTADMYARQFGLLETTPSTSGVAAKNGLPSDGAVSAYTAFVKGYLGNYDGLSATPPLVGGKTPQKIFEDNTALQAATIIIDQPSTRDERYLHARGLYVDYLEEDARKAIAKCVGDDKVECILARLPFTTINLTEMAEWTPIPEPDNKVLSVNSGSLLQFNVTQPFGGRTRGIGEGEATNQSELRKSNSGVAASDDIPGATDLNGDELPFQDGQAFEVGGATTGGGSDRFWVNIPSASSVTAVFYFVTGSTDEGGCFGNRKLPTKYDCATESTMPKDVDITVGSYNREQTLPTSMTHICTVSGSTEQRSVTASVDKPVLQNYAVTTVSGGSSVTINPAIHDTFADERTVIRVNGVAKDSTIEVTLGLESTRNDATIESCVTDKNGNKMSVTSWNKPWTLTSP